MENKYKTKIIKDPLYICNQYIKIVHTYFNVNLNSPKLNNEKYNNFILNKGIETISHIFNNLLLYTNNEELTYTLTDKSIYYFVEFIEQIYNEKNTYLELSIKEAIAFVYKKILVDIESKHIDVNDKNKIELIKLLIDIINQHFYYNFKNKILTEQIINDEFAKIKIIYDSLTNIYNQNELNFKDNLIILFELIIYLQQLNIYNIEVIILIINNIITLRIKLIMLDNKKCFNIDKLLNKIYNIDFKETMCGLQSNEEILNFIIN